MAVVNLCDLIRPCSESAKTILMELLARVDAGEITALAVGYTTHDHAIGTAYSEAENAGELMGAISLLQHRFQKDAEENAQ